MSNVLPGPAHEPSDKERPAPPNSDTVPIDLVPALYMVGAALPGSCNAILLDSAGRNTTNSTADLLSKLIKATQVGAGAAPVCVRVHAGNRAGCERQRVWEAAGHSGVHVCNQLRTPCVLWASCPAALFLLLACL